MSDSVFFYETPSRNRGRPKKIYEVTVNKKKHVITTKNKLYMLRHHIIERCYKSTKDKKWYGNVKVCDEWLNDPGSFYLFALKNGWKVGLTIDRINSDEDYGPDNCQFITQGENTNKSRHRRIYKMSEHEKAIRKLLKETNKKLIDIARELEVTYHKVRYVNDKVIGRRKLLTNK
jgi:hypothetical protein